MEDRLKNLLSRGGSFSIDPNEDSIKVTLGLVCKFELCPKEVPSSGWSRHSTNSIPWLGFCRTHYRHHMEGFLDEEGNINEVINPRVSPCKLDGCLRGILSKGFCSFHYNRYMHKVIDIDGTLLIPSKVEKPASTMILYGHVKGQTKDKICTVKRCSNYKTANGFCNTHSKHYLEGKINIDGNKQKLGTSYPKGKCCVPSCKKGAFTKGMCQSHYVRKASGRIDDKGNILIENKKRGAPKKYHICKMDRCDATKIIAYGFCMKHYGRWRRKHISMDGTIINDIDAKHIHCGKNCKVKDCEKLACGKHMFCNKHHSQYRSEILDIDGNVLRRLWHNKNRSCKVKGCAGKALDKEFCGKHIRHYKEGFIDIEGKTNSVITPPGKRCIGAGCVRGASNGNFCRAHYEQYRHKKMSINGKILVPKTRIGKNTMEIQYVHADAN